MWNKSPSETTWAAVFCLAIWVAFLYGTVWAVELIGL